MTKKVVRKPEISAESSDDETFPLNKSNLTTDEMDDENENETEGGEEENEEEDENENEVNAAEYAEEEIETERAEEVDPGLTQETGGKFIFSYKFL
jgi:hypothetical protein